MINSGVKFSPRPLTKIIGGFLSTTNNYTKKNNNTIEKHIKRNDGFKGLDIGCIADFGSFHIDYDGEEDTTLNKAEDFVKRYSDYYKNRKFNKIKFSKKDNSLVSFFLQLTRYLQQAIGTVPAIDLNAYSSAIGFEIDDKI